MATYYFGDSTGTVFDGNWNNANNWFTALGSIGSRKSSGFGGVPVAAGFTGPTSADFVELRTNVVTPYTVAGAVTAFGGTVTTYTGWQVVGQNINATEIVVNNAIFSGVYTGGGSTLNACTFTNTSTLRPTQSAQVHLNACTLNGTLNLSAPSISLWLNSCVVNSTWPERTVSPNFNLAWYTVVLDAATTLNTGYPLGDIYFSGTWNRPIALGGATRIQHFTLYTGFSSIYQVTLDLTASATFTTGGLKYSSFQALSGSTLYGLLTLVKGAGSTVTVNTGANYSPTLVVPAIKSGNYMTFNYSAMLAQSNGYSGMVGGFTPTVLLSGTSNEILGAGLL